MLSIIVCSRNTKLTEKFVENIDKTIGVAYEIIFIDNSKNAYSIFSAYNAGFSKSKYPYLCFVHDDVLFHTQNWGEKLIAHLQPQETGIIGFAGGDLATRVPASWSTLTPIINVIQSDRSGKKTSKIIQRPENYDQTKHSAVLLDGVCLCMKRELMKRIKFDENLSGFHGYDFDISIQSTVAGYTNYVIYDIELEHFSRGKTDASYYRNLIAVFKKWEKFLPLTGKSIDKDQCRVLPVTEEGSLMRLIKKMIRKGFTTKEIVSETAYYSTLIGSENALRNLKMRIFFIRLFNCPQYLIK
jgi:GT2 family glycosyltransferase